MSKLSTIVLSASLITGGLFAGMSLYANKTAEAKVEKAIDAVSDTVKVEYRSVSVSPLGFDVHIKDVTVSAVDDPTEIAVEKVIIREIDDQSDFPTVLDASLEGMQIAVADIEDPGVRNLLEQAGHTKMLSLDIDTKYQYKVADRKIRWDKLNLSADGVGDLDMSFELGNVDWVSHAPESSDAPAAQPVSNDQTIFYHAEITYRDQSLAEGLLTAMAAESNQSLSEFKAQMKTNLTQAAQFLISPENTLATEALNETMAFLDDPNGFSISAKPRQPVMMSDLMAVENPQDWVSLLNLQFQAF
ncbi:MAG: hypothetical protein AAF329_04475 [Cyanobacteria bacterium P01_A01_bin.17]